MTMTETRVQVPVAADAIRCWQCDKLLALSYGFSGRIELACKRCRSKNILTGSSYNSDRTKGREAEAVARTERLRQMGFKEELRPSTESILEMMEAKFRDQAKIRAQRAASVAVGLRFDVFKRDDFRCVYCGLSVADGVILHADHVIPESKGGPTVIDNLVTACLDCNLGKSNKDL